MTEIRRCAVIGAGVIGGGWAVRFVLNGLDVAVFDPHPDAERRTRTMLANAERVFAKLTLAPLPEPGELHFVGSIAEAMRDADFVQESAPEREHLKRELLAEIDARARSYVLVSSSTSGLLPSRLQSDLRHPGRFLVGHPFNPVYLLPLVELCGGTQTASEAIARAADFYKSIGMRPLHVRKEIDGFIADRLLEALWREALWLVHDDVATVEEVDDAIRFGAGLRWAMFGTFFVYRLAGGEDGMRHFMAQFGPTLKLPWTRLIDVPDLTDALIDKIAAQSDRQASGIGLREWEMRRDDGLLAIMQALKTQRIGAGAVLDEYEQHLYARAHRQAAAGDADPTQPLRLHEGVVRPDWVDYNNHMTESRYLQAFGDASDALLCYLGVDTDYLAGGNSYYTAETHIVHRQEAVALEPFYATTQVLAADEKRLHVFHRLHKARGNGLLATAEQMLLHVDTRAGSVCPARAEIAERVLALAAAQAGLTRPEQAGRSVGRR
jgi:carnitine 3-dehydrogenase